MLATGPFSLTTATDLVEGMFRMGSARMAVKAGLVMTGLDLALSGSMASRGHMASSMAGAAAGQIGGLAAATLGQALVPIPVVGAIVGLAAGYGADVMLRGTTEKIVQGLVELDGNRRQVKMGGGYRDSQIAYTMRQVAARELGSSLLNARHHLGKEAALMAD